MMLKTCRIALVGCLLLLAGCGSGASTEEAQIKDAAGSTPPGDAGRATDSGATVSVDDASRSDSQRDDLAVKPSEDAPTSPSLDTSLDSADAARETLGRDGPRPDSALPVDMVVDTRVADLGTSAEAGTIKPDSAADRADTSSSPPSFPCDDDSDCCIKIDTCMNVAYLYSTAPGASPAPVPPASSTCTACIPPNIQVRCVSRQCVGERLPINYSAPLPSSHCGPLKLPDAGASGTHLLPPLAPDASAPTPKSSWTCSGG